MVLLLRAGEDAHEFDADQCQQDQQVNPQGPQGKPGRSCCFDACHKSISLGLKLCAFHDVPVADDAQQPVLGVHHRQHG